jgi:hypothetical protein
MLCRRHGICINLRLCLSIAAITVLDWFFALHPRDIARFMGYVTRLPSGVYVDLLNDMNQDVGLVFRRTITKSHISTDILSLALSAEEPRSGRS